MRWFTRCECYWRVIRIWFIRITEMENLFRIGGDVLVRIVKRHDGWFTDEKNRSSGYQQVEKLTRNFDVIVPITKIRAVVALMTIYVWNRNVVICLKRWQCSFFSQKFLSLLNFRVSHEALFKSKLAIF